MGTKIFQTYEGPVEVEGVTVEITEKGRVTLIGPEPRSQTLETLEFMPFHSVRATCVGPELEHHACNQQALVVEFLKAFADRIRREHDLVKKP